MTVKLELYPSVIKKHQEPETQPHSPGKTKRVFEQTDSFGRKYDLRSEKCKFRKWEEKERSEPTPRQSSTLFSLRKRTDSIFSKKMPDKENTPPNSPSKKERTLRIDKTKTKAFRSLRSRNSEAQRKKSHDKWISTKKTVKPLQEKTTFSFPGLPSSVSASLLDEDGSESWNSLKENIRLLETPKITSFFLDPEKRLPSSVSSAHYEGLSKSWNSPKETISKDKQSCVSQSMRDLAVSLDKSLRFDRVSDEEVSADSDSEETDVEASTNGVRKYAQMSPAELARLDETETQFEMEI